MTDQLAITGLEPAPPAVVLTDNQQHVYEHLREVGELDAATAGRLYHERWAGHECDHRPPKARTITVTIDVG